MTQTNTRRLTESAILIAIATVLELVSDLFPLSLPFGGGFTIMSMLPIVLISYRYGIKWGLFSGFVYSIIQMLIGFKTVSAFFMPGDEQMVLWRAIVVCLFDYIFAYTALGFGGLFRNKFKKPATSLAVGSVVALSLRFLMHFISGALFFGSWAEWFFTQDAIASFGATILSNFSGFSLAMLYSFIYNATYMIPEIILTSIGAVVIGKIPTLNKKMTYQASNTPVIK
jgi:thiamine transporter